MKHLAILTIVLTSSFAEARPMEFARGRLVLPGADPVQHAPLPADVYEWVVREDLGDLRLYDRAGNEIPHAVRRPASIDAHSPWQNLPLFALPRPTASGSPAAVNIELGDGGAVVAVHGPGVGSTDAVDYLIDASGYDAAISELEFGWAEDSANFVGRFRLERSDDLDAWQVVTPSLTLAALATEGGRVLANRVAANVAQPRYLKLHALDSAPTVTVGSVAVRSRVNQAPQRDWKVLTGVEVDGGVEFDTGGLFPVDRISLELEAGSYLFEARLYSRPDGRSTWRDRGVRSFYRASVAGTTVAGEPIAYAALHDRFWRAEPTVDTGERPRLRIGWLPDELVFLNQGEPPFTLAYGQSRVTARAWPMEELRERLAGDRTLEQIAPARFGEPEMLGGADRRLPRPEPVDWRTIILWVILVLAVAAIGGLAWRLVRSSPAS